MNKLISFDAVKNLISQSGFGTYKLFALPSNEQVGGSHITEDRDKAMNQEELVADLEGKIELLGDGLYLILLKKSNMSPNTTEVRYRFQVVSEKGIGSSQVNSGYTSAEVETMINKRIAEALDAEREKQKLSDQLKEINWQMTQLKAAKRRPVAKKSGLEGMFNIMLMGGAAFISEKYPNSVPLVKEVIKSFTPMDEGEEEDEEEEEGGGTVRSIRPPGE